MNLSEAIKAALDKIENKLIQQEQELPGIVDVQLVLTTVNEHEETTIFTFGVEVVAMSDGSWQIEDEYEKAEQA